ncbi:MAG: IS30 family transposase [Oscillospiraceae bacterium]|nr:IS30 family transposase [Oscillospiraceae bacterium]
MDRRSGFLVAALMPDRKTKTLTGTVSTAFSIFSKSLLRSFIVDNGNEFFDYQNVERCLDARVYFADHYCSWQRGLNENTNGLFRQYFPKKCDFLAVSPLDFLAAVHSLNNRLRKRLGVRSLAECFPVQNLLHFP